MMKKKWITSTGKLGEVRESFFTVEGSPYFFFPLNKNLLLVLKGFYKGCPMRISFYKTSEDSNFVRVGKVKMDKYKVTVRAKSRRAVAYSEYERLQQERQSSMRKINGKGFHTGLSGKGEGK